MNCDKCGELLRDNASFCENCGNPVTPASAPQYTDVPPYGTQPYPNDAPTQSYPGEAPFREEEKPEKVGPGILGALIGALLGGASIVLLDQLGYVAAISGIILAFCAIKGYELLGGRVGKKGLIICIALMLVTPYIADRVGWAMVIQEAFAEDGVTFMECFAAVPALIQEELIDMGDYIGNLLMVYGFTALGVFSIARSLFKKK